MTPCNIGGLILPLLVLISCQTGRQTHTSNLTLQVYQFEELDSLMQIEPRPVAVFLHAPWCQYCRNMEQTTFANPAIIDLLNQQYYFVSFDGESEAPVVFRKHTFFYQPNGRNSGTHELAYALGSQEDQLIYPTFLILNPDYDIVFQHQAFLRAQDLQQVLSVAPQTR